MCAAGVGFHEKLLQVYLLLTLGQYQNMFLHLAFLMAVGVLGAAHVLLHFKVLQMFLNE